MILESATPRVGLVAYTKLCGNFFVIPFDNIFFKIIFIYYSLI